MIRKHLLGIHIAIFLALSCISQADLIHDAASTGDLATIRRLLQENPKHVNIQDPAGATPLLWASVKGQLDAARLLVESGADVNLPRADGWSPLHGAVCDGNWQTNLPIVRLLLDRGAKLEVSDKNGWTPLLAAAFRGNVEAIHLLLDRGASISAVDVKGSHALHFAAYGGNPTAVRFLIDRGANLEAKNKDGNRAIDLALGGVRLEVVDALLAPIHITVRFDDTPLPEAVRSLCEKAKVKFKFAEPATGKVTLNLLDVPFPSALKVVLRAPGVQPAQVYSISEGALLIAGISGAANTSARPINSDRRYRFERTISREVLNNYLSHAVTHYGLCSTSPEPATAYFEDDMRMLTSLGAKIVGRAAYAWVPPDDEEAHFRLARERASRVHQLDPDMILEACVFEAVYTGVERIPIPAWVFEEFRLPVKQRLFHYSAMLYDHGQYVNHWTAGASVPDMSKLETRMYFYYRARRYIDSGFESIHFGQVHLMDLNDPNHRHWFDLLGRLRRYASHNARRGMVLCNAHTHGVTENGKLLFDYHAYPLIGQDVEGKPQRVKLIPRYYNTIYGRSTGGMTPSGWSCDWLPYLCEFDCGGKNDKPGQASRFPWNWGYACGDWFAHQLEAYRREYLAYANRFLRDLHEDAWLQMPTRLNLAWPIEGQQMWHANRRSPACPVGFGTEDAIASVWQSDPNARTRPSGP